jgi:hypothetical protein
MLIIFGLRRRGYRMANVFAMCGICHSPAAQAVVRIKTFFTLFFVPIIPVGTKYRSTCTLCGGTIELSKDQADQAMVTMEQQRAQAQAQTPPSTPPPPAFAQASASPAPVAEAPAPPQVPDHHANGGEPPPPPADRAS